MVFVADDVVLLLLLLQLQCGGVAVAFTCVAASMTCAVLHGTGTSEALAPVPLRQPGFAWEGGKDHVCKVFLLVVAIQELRDTHD